MSFLGELKRRNVFRLAAFYIVASWLILQVGELLFETLGVPDWSLKLVLGLLVLGFPIALMFAWIYEVTESGIRKQSEVDRDTSITHHTGKRLDVLTIVLLLAVAGMILVDRLHPVDDQADLRATAAATATNGPATSDDETPAVPSMAVLPFSNMSPDADNEYFADGITEELLNTLVRVPGILVAARTSAFSYKGQNKDVRVIGEELGVDHIVEGSVRKSGNDLRITAQLIRVSDGFHLWSQTYDRKLENIFAIQEEIATEIAQALQAPLGLASALVANRTENIENYDLYLEAKQLLRVRKLEPAISALQEVVLREPDYAPAWANLATALVTLPGYQDTLDGKPLDYRDLARLSLRAARRAVELDPKLPDAHHALGNVLRNAGQWDEARASFQRALDLDPNSVEILEDWRQFQQDTGHVGAAVEAGARGYALEPQSALATMAYADALFIARQYERSEELATQAIDISPQFSWPQFVLAEIALIQEDFGRAYQIYSNCEECLRFSNSDTELEVLLALREGREPRVERDDLLRSQLAQVVFEAGGQELVLELMERNVAQVKAGEGVYLVAYFNNPFMDELRKTPRYKQIVQGYSLPAYWRQFGWPDYCRPVGDDDFECGAYEP